VNNAPAPSANAPQFGIVVVNFGSCDLIAENLGGIDWPGQSQPTVVVVDNYSSVDERRAIERLAVERSWMLVRTAANLGFAAGMNRGVARAIELGCSHVLLLNPDVRIGPRAISRLFAFGVDHPNTLVSPRLDHPDGSTWFSVGQLDLRTGLTRSRIDAKQEGPGRWLTGACLVVDRDSWALLGGFDERFFLYWEDIDLSQRFLGLGGTLVVLDDVAAVHSVGGTQGAGGRSAVYAFYMCRNRLLFAVARLPMGYRLRWLLHAPRYAVRAVLPEGRRAALRRPALALAALRGTIVGGGAVLRSVRHRGAKGSLAPLTTGRPGSGALAGHHPPVGGDPLVEMR
jgi:N-acetylglucosaminyl-diphospho-decaprenol L-rhamnosyltransferase